MITRKNVIRAVAVVFAVICMGSLLSQNTLAASRRKKALAAYRNILHSKSKVGNYANREWNDYFPEDNMFALVDANKDHVPEMLVTTNGGYKTSLLAYVNGRVKTIAQGFAGGVSTTGGFVFYPNKKLILTKTFHGSSYVSYYRYTGKKTKLLCSRYDSSDIPSENVTTFKIKKKKVSKAAYKKYVNKIRKKAKKKKVTFRVIKASNIKKYVK